MHNWLLPEFIEDILPAQAAQIEQMRRNLLDLFSKHGYQFVIPPMLEYTESLITGAASDLDLATFKVVDQLTGRLMGVRADITPQTARIDAHMLNQQGVTRLCYAGTVLRTKPDGLARTREPLQVGAELYGYSNVAADIEVQRLLIDALKAIGVRQIHLDFSHVGIFEALVAAGNIAEPLEMALYAALQSKDRPFVAKLASNLPANIQQALQDLTELHGDDSVLARAAKVLPKLPEITKALADLTEVAAQLAAAEVQVGFDLSELRGYHYHSGIVFAAYAQGYAGPLALGGRYDNVGESFGRARAATGFSLDLRGVAQALPQTDLPLAILAPAHNDAALQTSIDALRSQGEVVIQLLPNETSSAKELSCDRELRKQGNDWIVSELN